jgi:hypothetical protein
MTLPHLFPGSLPACKPASQACAASALRRSPLCRSSSLDVKRVCCGQQPRQAPTSTPACCPVLATSAGQRQLMQPLQHIDELFFARAAPRGTAQRRPASRSIARHRISFAAYLSSFFSRQTTSAADFADSPLAACPKLPQAHPLRRIAPKLLLRCSAGCRLLLPIAPQPTSRGPYTCKLPDARTGARQASPANLRWPPASQTNRLVRCPLHIATNGAWCCPCCVRAVSSCL